MDDKTIIDLYWQRSESAVALTAEKYGKYAHSIAYHILGDAEDSEECVNDAYIKVWTSIPPQRPGSLSAFLGAVTRNLSLDRYRANHAAKRGQGQAGITLDELTLAVPKNFGFDERNERISLMDILSFLYYSSLRFLTT